MSCQLTSIDEIKQNNTRVNNILQIRVKMLRPAKRNLIFLKNRISRSIKPTWKSEKSIALDKVQLRPGDMVKVRCEDEIRSMLDDHEKYKGCLFIDEMFEHCDKFYTVFKNIEYFFDEARQKMCRCKDTVILEGAVCSGRQRLYSVSCDRNCFFFWHQDWLKKSVRF